VREHAINSAKLISAIKPEYVGFLTLMVEPGTELYKDYREGKFELLTPSEVMQELKIFIENVDSKELCSEQIMLQTMYRLKAHLTKIMK